jgi:Na+(H+)/acetate symporter ActP
VAHAVELAFAVAASTFCPLLLLGIWWRGLTARGAIAAFLATSSGLLVSIAGALSTDVLRGRVRDFRAAAVVAGLVPLAIALPTTSVDISRVVGMAFAVAASTFCPLLVLGIWWRGLTAVGAIAGLLAGGVTASAAVTATMLAGPFTGWTGALLAQPAAWTVPLAFLTMVGGSLLTRGRVPLQTGRLMIRLHTPEGLDVDRGRPGA